MNPGGTFQKGVRIASEMPKNFCEYEKGLTIFDYQFLEPWLDPAEI
jgi:hypothetical protein